MPALTPALAKLYDLDVYDDAEIERKKIGAAVAGVIRMLNPDFLITPEGSQAEPTDAGFLDGGFEPGTFPTLAPGEDIEFNRATDVGGQYEAFWRQQLRGVAVGQTLTYEMLSGDYSESNYSSMRGNLLDVRRALEMAQHHVLVFQMCRPVWRWFIEAAALSGAIRAADYAADPNRYLSVKWIPHGWDWVDPEKDAAAEAAKVRGGFKSRSEVVSELGYDAEEVDDEIRRDNERADRLGLVLDSDPRRVDRSGRRTQDVPPRPRPVDDSAA